MTIMYKGFTINVLGNNVVAPASARLECSAGEKKKFLFIKIGPQSAEDVFFKVSFKAKSLTEITGEEGYHHSIVDDYTHQLDFGNDLSEGDYVTVSAYGPNARTIYGVFAYEVL